MNNTACVLDERTINQVTHTLSRDGTTDAGLIYSLCSVLPASRLNSVWTERALPSALPSDFLSPVSLVVVPRWATHPASSSAGNVWGLQSVALQRVGLPVVVWTRVEFVCFSQVDIKMLFLIRGSWLGESGSAFIHWITVNEDSCVWCFHAEAAVFLCVWHWIIVCRWLSEAALHERLEVSYTILNTLSSVVRGYWWDLVLIDQSLNKWSG